MPNLHDRADRFQFLVEELQTKGDTQSTMGSEILRMLWEIYRDSLYQTEEYTYATEDMEVINQRFETFPEFCDEVIRTHFDPADYFDKFKWVVERVFRYIYIRTQDEEPILIPVTGEPLTVDMLLDAKGWISKLIIISNKIELCRTDEEIESLFFAGINGDVADVKQAGEDVQDARIEIRIPYIERPLDDDLYTLHFNEITSEQYALIIKRMGRILEKHLA